MIRSVDPATAEADCARALSSCTKAGAVFVHGIVASAPRLPFGGIRQSGDEREPGVHGLREFTKVKTVWAGPAH